MAWANTSMEGNASIDSTDLVNKKGGEEDDKQRRAEARADQGQCCHYFLSYLGRDCAGAPDYCGVEAGMVDKVPAKLPVANEGVRNGIDALLERLQRHDAFFGAG